MKTTKSLSEASQVHKAALAYVKSGLSVVPTGKDKIPRVKHWKERESKIPSEKSVKKDFSRPGICVAIVCGKVSGGLETIDFDFEAEQFKPWKDLVEMDAPGLVDRLVIQKTQSGGRHATYRCSNGEVPGSAKLMSKWIEVDGDGEYEHKGKKLGGIKINGKYYINPAYIETRGEGGYFLAYPSPGYEIEQHRFSQVPNITPEERDILIEAAGALNERPPENPTPAREPRAKTSRGLSPGDDYGQRGDVEALLIKHGWKKTNRRSSCGNGVHWQRPEKRKGQSATLYGSEYLYNFSTNGAPFQAYTGYSAFAVYAVLEHGGDFSAAAKDLAKQGYGDRSFQTTQIHTQEPGAGEWGEPVNVFDNFSLGEPTWQSYFCPDVINDFAFDEAERMGVLPEQVAGPAIIVLAGAIDDGFVLQPKKRDDTWLESARLWGAVLGDSGTRKSPAKLRADQALKRIEHGWYLDYRKKYERYEHELQQYNDIPKKDRFDMNEPKKPVQRRLICNDTTIEALRDILGDGGGASKITLSWDELGAMLGTFDAYRANSKNISRDRGLYLELYNGGSRPIDRANFVNVYVPNWSACISGTITPDVLLSYFGKLSGDGLLQRFLLYRADRIGSGIDRTPDKAAEKRFLDTVAKLVTIRPEVPHTIIKFSGEAQVVRTNFERIIEMAYSLPGSTPAFKAHLNKFSGMFCRLALTFYLADAISRGNSIEGPVSENIADMAASVLIDYHILVAREFYGKLGFGPGSEKSQRVAEVASYILCKEGPEIAARDITMNIRGLKGRTKEAQAIMEELEQYDWARPSKVLKKANRTTVWAVNPKVRHRFERQARIEAERRAKSHRNIQEAIKTFSRKEG
jgi:hypothetical protein